MAATTRQCVASMARLSLSSSVRPTTIPAATTVPKFLAPAGTQVRWKGVLNPMKIAAAKRDREKKKAANRGRRHKEYKYAVPSGEEQFALCDAMRYLRAAEVGRPPNWSTYEVHVRMRTVKNGPVIRNRVRLPYPVKNDTRIAVICKEDSPAMADAQRSGAVAYGEESLYEMIRKDANNLPFNRLICHTDCEASLKRAGLGRLLGPKGLMPSLKTNTLTRNVVGMMREMAGAQVYREKTGIVHIPIGNIQHGPKQLSENIKTLIQSIRGDIERIEDKVDKNIIEVVLSSSSGPGFPLSGGFMSKDEALQPEHLTSAM